MKCDYCGDEIGPDDTRAPVKGGAFHYECVFRMAAGSAAHIRHLCSCYVRGSREGDPPKMSRREGALAALDAYYDIKIWKGRQRPVTLEA